MVKGYFIPNTSPTETVQVSQNFKILKSSYSTRPDKPVAIKLGEERLVFKNFVNFLDGGDTAAFPGAFELLFNF